MLAGHFLTRDIGRICSVWFIKHHIVPNQITVLMIVFGIIGSIAFALPNVWSKLVGYMFWILWFAMDCSDGQVARYTQTFSKYGTEMDYMAHLIDHTLMNIAIWLTYVEMGKFDAMILSLIFIISISCELSMRNLFTFGHYETNCNDTSSTAKCSIIKYLRQQLCLYPTMIVCFSWIVIIDYQLDSGFSLYLYCIWLILFLINYIVNMIARLKKIYKSKI